MGDHNINAADDNKWLRLIFASSSSSSVRPLILRYFCCSGNCWGPGHLRISIIDGQSEKECRIKGLKSIEEAYFVGCCNGLALFHSTTPSSLHIVVNPSSNEIQQKIYGPFRGGHFCGFFYHPLAKEYRILNVLKLETDRYEYNIYLFGAKKWRRIENPYFSRIPSQSRNVKGRYRIDGNPANMNDALHWDIGEIMVFDIINEEFSIRVLPFEGDYHRGGCFVRHLLVKDNRLCFCIVGHEAPLMDIWILEDYAKWRWVRKYIVNLDWDMNKYPMEEGIGGVLYYLLDEIRVVAIKNDEL
ncbi:hypothetical protein MIMGU_mgv1a024112mg, partial [Erythranthe guttata]